MSFEYVLFDLSYANLSMYGAVIPSYKPKDNKGGSNGSNEKIIRADDKKNADRVKQIFETFD